MTKQITFQEAYEAAQRLTVPPKLEPTAFEAVKRIMDRATVDIFLTELKMEGGASKEEAKAWIKEMREIYSGPLDKAADFSISAGYDSMGGDIIPRHLNPASIKLNGDTYQKVQDTFAKKVDRVVSDAKAAVQEWNKFKDSEKDDSGERYKVVGILPTPAVTKTPAEWCEELGENIIDPDGWRGNMYRDWNDPITRAEFEWRAIHCTKALYRKPLIKKESDPQPF